MEGAGVQTLFFVPQAPVFATSDGHARTVVIFLFPAYLSQNGGS